MRTPTVAINSKLKIVKLTNCRFSMKSMTGYYNVNGFALHHSQLGYVSFDGEVPYIPRGGEEALQSILDEGGFVEFNGMHWVQEIQ
ncbi:hypothetical protein J6TS7_29260 [Paenibacillus dendritiformis]|uniref:3-isopropylmalate dehydratase n=1 Tax=Paenibacillus TaxID=44249 RepID=UPI001B1B38EC|nr:3-isopropylmalate dehydratase [Paenibacillus dendritiformis]GIO79316.1 hypothetical protein J6TS7_29260 [Paenibacillus dendritiformis]